MNDVIIIWEGLNKITIKDNGYLYTKALMVLSEIIGCVREEKSIEIQKQYKYFKESLYLGIYEVKSAIKFLQKKEVISVDFRSCIAFGKKINNVMFIKLNVDTLELHLEKNVLEKMLKGVHKNECL